MIQKNIYTVLFLLMGIGGFAQDLYDINAIQDIRIVFAESNWDALLDAQAASTEDYIPAQSVTINGTVFNNVGVKYKGNSTYSANRVKNPFHIELDTYQSQNYQGYTDIKLSNVYFDPSFLREPLSYAILRQYMDAPLCNYANVYVNGTLIGLYTSAESISKRFVDEHFYSNNNAFFKCNPIGGAGPGSSSYPNLAYLGTNITSYQTAYEMNSTTGWEDLVTLTNTLANDINNIESVLDVDRALWMLAFDNALVNLDSYIGTFKQNYYLYKDDNGRFNPVVWDLNMSFGVFSQTGTIALNTTTAKKQMTHLLHASDAAWPLVQKLLAVPKYKRMYLAHYKTIMEENFANNSYLTTAQSYQTIINAAVQADPNKQYTYAQYQSNLNTDITGGMNAAPGITNLMSGRNTYLNTLADFTNVQPTITSVAPAIAEPLINSDVFITANVVNTNTNGVYLGYRSDKELPFTKVLMYDDGAHGDGAANDNVYGAAMNMSKAFMQYYIYAENNNVGKFSPVRAEHEFYTLHAVYPTINPGDLVVNELMAQNTMTIADQDGEFEDWIELYNNTDTTLSLDNLYMTDTDTNLIKWAFPSGLTIEPHGYLTIWADEDGSQVGLHANFKLSSAGESLILAYANGTIIENISFGAQTADMGYARIPNGTGNFVIQVSTFNANNETLSVSSEAFQQNLSVYPNPTQNVVYIQNKNHQINRLELYNLQGQLIDQKEFTNTQAVSYDVSSYPKGVYLLTINRNTTVKLIRN
ncbi:MAG: CotH kinase family protein [Bacteroidetes bacterium]|nr:CotH kinase family protein [Bacteroidota bacterium]